GPWDGSPEPSYASDGARLAPRPLDPASALFPRAFGARKAKTFAHLLHNPHCQERPRLAGRDRPLIQEGQQRLQRPGKVGAALPRLDEIDKVLRPKALRVARDLPRPVGPIEDRVILIPILAPAAVEARQVQVLDLQPLRPQGSPT